MREGLPYKQFLVGFNPPFLRLAERLTVICTWCEQYVPGSRRNLDVLRMV